MKPGRLFSVGLFAQVLRVSTTLGLVLWATRVLPASGIASFLLAQGVAVLAARFVSMGTPLAMARVALGQGLDLRGLLGLGLLAVSGNSRRYGPIWLAVASLPLGYRYGLSGDLVWWTLTIMLWGLGVALSQIGAEAARVRGLHVMAAATQGVVGSALSGIISVATLAALTFLDVAVSARTMGLIVAAAVYSGPGLVLVRAGGIQKPPTSLVGDLHRQAAPAGLAQLLNFASMEAPGWVAVTLLSDVASASIMLAARLAAQAAMPSYVLSTSIGVQSIGQIYGRRHEPVGLGSVPALYGAIAVFCVAAIGVTALWPDPVQLLAGPELAVTSDVVPILVFPSLIMAVTGGANQLVQMTEMARLSVRNNAVVFAVAVPLQMLAAYRFGAVGLAVVFSVSLSVMYLLDYGIVRGKIGFDRSPVTFLAPKPQLSRQRTPERPSGRWHKRRVECSR